MMILRKQMAKRSFSVRFSVTNLWKNVPSTDYPHRLNIYSKDTLFFGKQSGEFPVWGYEEDRKEIEQLLCGEIPDTKTFDDIVRSLVIANEKDLNQFSSIMQKCFIETWKAANSVHPDPVPGYIVFVGFSDRSNKKMTQAIAMLCGQLFPNFQSAYVDLNKIDHMHMDANMIARRSTEHVGIQCPEKSSILDVVSRFHSIGSTFGLFVDNFSQNNLSDHDNKNCYTFMGDATQQEPLHINHETVHSTQ